MERMFTRLIAVTGCASALAAVDLAAKALWPPPPELFHHRSTAWILASFVLLTCCLVLALRSSAIMCAAAATCAGGLVGNLVSALTHGGRIPDPFLLGGAIAFNPADVFFVVGLSGLVCASIQRVATSTAWLSLWRGGIRNELTTPRDPGRFHGRARGSTRRPSRGLRDVGASRGASTPRASRPMREAQEGRLYAASTAAEAQRRRADSAG